MKVKRMLDRCGIARLYLWKVLMNYKNHNHIIQEDNIKLRPLCETHWEYLFKWNKDKEILYFSEGDDISEYSSEETKQIYTYVSQKADIFIIEYLNEIVGECWLQEMNLNDIMEKLPNKNIYRIDLMIGRKELWNKGIGSQVINMLTKYGVREKKADMIFAVISDYNLRSLKAFSKNKYVEYNRVEINSSKSKEEIRLVYRNFV
ncbi:GNAT family N-acetyltransferase [Treponema denticola]|uniref:GNAT family N-acetyltransferase n=1 Tax=Treponema denticola TaxID=158 RepID=UPI0020A5746C|nr:GNAT family N-acetyltransferase [Treponema denticola]UTC82754.1 GNAT family N-acetyltransferase [Treponema denticola]